MQIIENEAATINGTFIFFHKSMAATTTAIVSRNQMKGAAVKCADEVKVPITSSGEYTKMTWSKGIIRLQKYSVNKALTTAKKTVRPV